MVVNHAQHHVQRLALVFLAAVAACPAAPGDDAVTPRRLAVAANFNAASVYAFFDGDTDADATASMEYRVGGTGRWRPGHPLARTGDGRVAGSIFHLQPDQPLEVRVTFADPDGVSEPRRLSAASRTRSDRFPAGMGRTLHVRRDDANAEDADACRSLQEAVDRAHPGDTIVVAAGDWFESVTIRRSGRPDAYITIRADAAPSTADSAAAAGRPRGWLVGHDSASCTATGPWRRVAERLFVAREERPVGTLTCAGTRLYHHESLDALRTAKPPLDRGWWQDEKSGEVYVRVERDAPPQAGDVAAGVLPWGLAFEACGYWIVEGLGFSCFGGGDQSRGIDVVDSHDIVVRDCHFHTMRKGVVLRRNATQRCLVERCTFRDTGIWTWPWSACKLHDVEGSGIAMKGGAGNVARFNSVRGFFNGIDAGTWGDLENEVLNRDLDIHDNQLTEIGDDALEPEGACMNVRFWNNQARGTFQCLSLAPITVGPVYVVRDRYLDFKAGGVKLSVDSTGAVYLYHVLAWTDRPGSSATSVCGPWDGVHFRNCILRAERHAIDDAQRHPMGCSFDFCDLFAAQGTAVVWEGREYETFAELPRPTFGGHLLRGEPYPAKRSGDPAALAPALIDAGVVIPGVNDGFQGRAPDIGPDEVR